MTEHRTPYRTGWVERRVTHATESWWVASSPDGFTARATQEQPRMFHSQAYWTVPSLRIVEIGQRAKGGGY